MCRLRKKVWSLVWVFMMRFADKSGFWALIRFLLGWGKSGHPHFLGILLNLRHWSLLLCVAIGYIIQRLANIDIFALCIMYWTLFGFVNNFFNEYIYMYAWCMYVYIYIYTCVCCWNPYLKCCVFHLTFSFCYYIACLHACRHRAPTPSTSAGTAACSFQRAVTMFTSIAPCSTWTLFV